MINKYSKFFISTFKNIGVCLAVAVLSLTTLFCCPNFQVAAAKETIPQTATAQEITAQTSPKQTAPPQETTPQTSPEQTAPPQETTAQTSPKYTATVTSPTPREFILGWDKITGAESYSVACNGYEVLQNIIEPQCCISQLLTKGGEYNFLITAYQNGSSLLSIDFHYTHFITVKLQDKPLICANMLVWNSVPNATSYKVIVNDIVVATTANTTFDLLPRLIENRQYSVKILCCNASPYYACIASLPLEFEPAVKPLAPTNLFISSIGHRVYASWNVSRFDVYYCVLNDADFAMPSPNFNLAGSNIIDITDLVSNGKKFVLIVKTVDNKTESVFKKLYFSVENNEIVSSGEKL